MKNMSKALLTTVLFGGISLGLTTAADADLVNGNFTQFTGTAPGVGTDTALDANTLVGWVNNSQVVGQLHYTL